MVIIMEITVKPKRWGNSLGITIPKTIVEEEKISLKDELIVDIRRKRDTERIKSLFGRFKFRESTQEIKDRMKKGWD